MTQSIQDVMRNEVAMQNYKELKRALENAISDMRSTIGRKSVKKKISAETLDSVRRAMDLLESETKKLQKPGPIKLEGHLLTYEEALVMVEEATQYKWKKNKDVEDYSAEEEFNRSGFTSDSYALHAFRRDARSRDELRWVMVFAAEGHAIVSVANDRAGSESGVIRNDKIIQELK